MKYFSKKTSERLAKIGCVSKMRHIYILESIYPNPLDCKPIHESLIKVAFDYYKVIAFHAWDICGNEDYCKENASKLWSENHDFKPFPDGTLYVEAACTICKLERKNPTGYYSCTMEMRHALIDVEDPEQLVVEALDRLGKE